MYQQYLNQAQSAISNLSSDELKELLNDDDKLEVHVNDALKGLEEEKERILTSNCALAQENVDREPEIIEKKSRLNDLSEEGKELCSVVQEKLNTLKSKKGDTTPETVLALLQTKAAECEETSDRFVSKLTNKESTVEEFLDTFLDSRKEMHLRKLKVDKMVELIQQQKNASRGGIGGGIPARPAPYPSNFYGTPGGNVPYPTGPYQMPMPGVPGLPGITGAMYRQPF